MFFDVGLELAPRQRLVRFGQARIEHAVVILQREFRVYRHHSSRLRQQQHAIGAGAIGQVCCMA